MKFAQFYQFLATATQSKLSFELPGGEALPAHFHVTEVSLTRKDFVDCGGVRRSDQSCVLQTLVADDTDHRLAPAKLAGILRKSTGLGISDETEIEVEIQGRTIETYRVASCRVESDQIVFALSAKQTACLAADACGITSLPVAATECCSGRSACC